MLKKKIFFLLFVSTGIFSLTESFAQRSEKTHFSIVEDKSNKRVDITVGGKPFTSYIYPDDLMKPVLYPLRTSRGTFITRGWPLNARPGERVDHPHHVGLWFNYGDVNGLDFWNNSTDIPADRKHRYGTIKHRSVNKISYGNDQAVLEVTADWQKPDGSNLLREETKFVFSGDGEMRVIERISTLTALTEDVSFQDNKEGLFGIRVARELEHPFDEPDQFIDASGQITDKIKPDNQTVTGKYRSSEGIDGEAAWGKRAKWVNLNGRIGNEAVSVVILDHPDNTGFPAYWHARGYGLFAANPLGQKEFSNGKEELNFRLPAGKSVTFRYKVLIYSGSHLSDEQVKAAFERYSISR